MSTLIIDDIGTAFSLIAVLIGVWFIVWALRGGR